ncbi:MAG: arginase family protein [Flavobacteriales bacterium]|nr:arginase family protein [Flavobacteriales bacterium]
MKIQIKNNNIPITLGGDHSISLGSINSFNPL